MKDPYDNDYGIELKTWFDRKDSESEKTRYVTVYPWHYERRIIERDGLISLQVTVHPDDRGCWTCKERICFVKERFAEDNVPCFWTREPDDGYLYVTVGPLPQHTSVEKYLTFLLVLPVHIYPDPEKNPGSRRKTKGRPRRVIQ
jgi:hypothetical protein